MDNNEKSQIESELQDIVTATTKLSFPFLSSKKEKETMILMEKEHIDYFIDKIIEKYDIPIYEVKYGRDKLWDNAQSISVKKFSMLPTNLQINSFWLQEVLHEYADNQMKQILQVFSAKSQEHKLY